MTASGTVDRDDRGGRGARRGRQRQRRLDQHRQHGDVRRDRADGDDQPGGGQADPTNGSPINFTVVFSEPVAGLCDGRRHADRHGGRDDGDRDRAAATTYNVAVSGMTGNGTVIATIGAGVAHDAAGNGNTASTSTDNTVTYDAHRPTVTINQAAGQADPTNASPINFTVVFSEPVAGFATGDVTLAGTAGARRRP